MRLPVYQRLWSALVLALLFVRELASSATTVAAAAFSRKPELRPAIVAVPLELRTRLGVATVANLTSLTPGTTSLHTNEDGSILYVHVMNVKDEAAAVSDIKDVFERWVRRVEGWR